MLEWRGDELFFGRHCVRDMAERFPTPFFVFDQLTLEQNYRDFVSVFSGGQAARAYFSVKTNCELAVLRILSSLGASAEVATGHELALALKAGFPASSIVMERPYLAGDAIEYCLRERIAAFYVDSQDQLDAVRRVARQVGLPAPISLRVNLGLRGFVPGLAEVYLKRFGIPEADVLPLVREIATDPNTEFVGLTTHLGSQHLRPRPYLVAVDRMVALATRIEATGVPVREINLGGGFPSPSLIKTTLLRLALSKLGIEYAGTPRPLAEFGRLVSTRFARAITALRHPPALAFEPGRAIASTMGLAVTRVRAVKGPWIVVDVSHTSLPESLFFAERRIVPTRPPAGPARRYNIAGATLNSADVLAMGRRLPALRVGDVLAVQDAGAYTISRASRFANLNPPIYLINERQEPLVIRRGEQVDDVLGPMEVR